MPDVAAVAAPAKIARGAAVAAISTAAVAPVTRTANGVTVEFTLVLAVAAHWRKRTALPDVAADMVAAALVGRNFRQTALAVTATLAVADVLSESPATVAVPAMTTAADASSERNLPAVAVADVDTLDVAETYFIAAGPTLADAIDAVRFADGIAPVSNDLFE